ncbi:MAG TPA: translocation/assembly module TamB domain-containing protein [Bryobacteraceae bacterium]|jgi:translocation and assembly module TamB|nr:translocation/assembly module TamB domain-containing protein [Bryobacteraceae bacterium]
MSRRSRILLAIGGSLAALILILVVTALTIVRTDRFRTFVREKIVAAIATSTGGRAEIGDFTFDPRDLRAHIEHLVVHGEEPPGVAPFLDVRSIDLQVRLFSGWRNLIGLESLSADHPVVNVMILANGETNIPSPKTSPKPSDESALETVVDVAIRHFTIQGGLAQLSGRKTDFSGRGENLRVSLNWNLVGQRYEGELSINPLTVTPPGRSPVAIALHVPVQLEKDRIRIANATIFTGLSRLTVSGAVENMKSPVTSGNLNGAISLEEVGNLLGVTLGTIRGTVQVSARGRVLSASEYSGDAEINGADIALSSGGRQVRGVRLDAAVGADPRQITVKSLRVQALGGAITANADLRNLDRLTTHAQLKNFDVQVLLSALAGTRVNYASSISGALDANGSLKAPGVTGLQAQVRLALTPKSSGIPVAGRIVAEYDGARGTIPLKDLQLYLPNTRLSAHGVLGQQVDLDLVSRNLRDVSFGSYAIPVVLDGGTATLTTQIRGRLDSPQISGHAAITRFSWNQRKFDRFETDLRASASNASVQNAQLTRGSLQARFDGSVGLDDWRLSGKDRMSLTASIRNGDLADILALAGQSAIPATGALSAQANLTGTVGNPAGTAEISIIKGTIYQEPFDTIQASARFSDRLIELPSARLSAGAALLEVKGSYSHPSDTLSTGQIQAQVASNDLAIAQIQALQKRHPGLAGTIRVNASLAGDLHPASQPSEFVLSSISADLHAMALRDTRQAFGDVNVTARTNGSVVDFHGDSNFAGSTVKVTGQTQLARDYPTTAHAAINALPIEKVLSVAGSSFPARGTLSVNADLSGTRANLRSDADFQLTNAVIYQEPFNRIEGAANYTPDSISLSRLTMNAPAGVVDLKGSFSHDPNNFDNGRMDLHVSSARLDLGRVVNLQQTRPGLGGGAQLTADIEATLQTRDGHRDLLLSKGDANGSVSRLILNGKPLGNASLRAQTAGKLVSFELQSDVAKSDIQATGQVTLGPGYPVAAKLVFKNVTYSGFQGVIAIPGSTAQFDALAEGQVDVAGPVMDLPNLRANLQLSRLELSTGIPGGSGSARPTLALQNQGPVIAVLASQQVRLQNANFTGPSMQVSVNGTAPLAQRGSMNLAVNGDIDLKVLSSFSSDLSSAGRVVLNANLGGTLAQPRVSGKAELKDVSLYIADAPNGISSANGAILLDGTNATIQTLTARVGGGETSITGSASFSGPNQNYNLQLRGNKIRTRYQGASVVTDLNLGLQGSKQRSTLSGDVTIRQVTYAPESDLGSMLYKVSAPVAASTPSPYLSNMRLNVRIRTATSTIFRTTLAQTIQATADLRLRGTAESPGMTGRIDITQGTLLFFGNQYTVDEGNVSFYNSSKIEPIVGIAFETKAQGVQVTMRVSGPMDDLKLSYTSDPPLRFEEIVALLATGKTPSDPTIAAHQSAPPDQTVPQMGESALVQQTVANPLANRLQRVFGVSQLKIDPTFTTGSTLPQARLTLQQQVTPEITFSYSQDLTQSNSQLIRVEWAFTRRFSAVATRDESGIVGLDFFYKKQFR